MEDATRIRNMDNPDIPGYRVVEEIGRGGMAVVYKALQVSLGRYVALKVLNPYLASDPELVKRFQREAEAAAVMKHPNIVTIYDVGEANGYYFIAMEYVKGKSLKEYLTEKGPLSPKETIRILRDVASALDYAHKRGFVHRDVKPSNVLIDAETGRALLTDFGVVKALHEETHLTHTGTFIGTVRYSSPEQIQGKSVGEESDLYSFGVMAYEMLSGRTPFEGSVTAVMHAHVYEPVPPLSSVRSDLPESLNEVFWKALAKAPDERYESAKEFVKDIEACFRSRNIHKGRLPHAEKKPHQKKGDTSKKEVEMEDQRTVVAPGRMSRAEVERNEKGRRRSTTLFAGILGGVLVLIVLGLLAMSSLKEKHAAETVVARSHATSTAIAHAQATAAESAVETATAVAYLQVTATKRARKTATAVAHMRATATERARETATAVAQAHVQATATDSFTSVPPLSLSDLVGVKWYEPTKGATVEFLPDGHFVYSLFPINVSGEGGKKQEGVYKFDKNHIVILHATIFNDKSSTFSVTLPKKDTLILGSHTLYRLNEDFSPLSITDVPSYHKQYLGYWTNVDPNTRSIPALAIFEDVQGTLQVHVWGRCGPTWCYWGAGGGKATDQFLYVYWDHGFSRRHMFIFLMDQRHLKVLTVIHFTDNSGRSDFLEKDEFQKSLSPAVTPSITLTPSPSPTITPSRLTFNDKLVALKQRFGIECVRVPAGKFIMGSPEGEGRDNEHPQHKVYLGEYWIGKTEVTNAEYEAFIKAGGYHQGKYWTDAGWKWREENNITQPRYWSDNTFNRPNYPVVGVSWYEAVAFTRWLSEVSGLNVRLPTEAEWEKAARGVDGRKYPWGNTWDVSTVKRLNFADRHTNYDWSDKSGDDGYKYTAPVGSYPAGASPYGAMDMAGNVWEWTSSLYKPYPYNADDGRENPDALGYRVDRGSSWYINPGDARTAFRGFGSPGYQGPDIGFRVAISVPQR